MSRIVVVTGAGRGLGFCIMNCHLAMGDKVYAFDYQITDELIKTTKENKLVKAYQCDIGSDESVAKAMCDVLADETKLDIIYNVAGIFMFDQRGGLTETNMDACMRMYNINCLGAMRICKTAWSLIMEGTVVLNVSSESGSIGAARRTGEYGYGMSKAALNMGSKLLSNELWKVNARVLNIHPGWLRTNMGGDAAFQSNESVAPEESAEKIVSLTTGIDEIPRDQMYMQYNGLILPW